LKNHYEQLVTALGVEKRRPVSRAQLPRILEKVSVTVFNNLIFSHFGISLNEKERTWLAIDGKELRGSIASGEKRGEVVVQAVTHKSRKTIAQSYYCGKKESEVPTVRKLLAEHELLSRKMSFDALHCKPQTLEMIAESKGKYLVGLKENQKQLLQQIVKTAENQAILWKISENEKGHGRIETRRYEFYDILEMEKAERWKDCQIRTLIKVNRLRNELKSGKKSMETSYYVSNEVGTYEELSQAIRRHWQVETNNHIRDVTLKEDQLRSKKNVSVE
jgi:predicted transposase YbfD/YdcC